MGIMEQLSPAPPLLAIRGFLNVLDDLRAGITTERAAGDINDLEISIRDSIELGELPGPRLLVCARPLRPTHGGWTADYGVDGEWEVRRCVREAIFRSADFIKLFATNIRPGPGEFAFRKGDLTQVPCYTRQEIVAAAEEAHRVGYRITAHAFGCPALAWCLDAGYDTIEHANSMETHDIDRLLRSEAVLSDRNLQGLFDQETGFSSRISWTELPACWRTRMETVRNNTRDVLGEALARGIVFALGTDSNHGRLWREAYHFVHVLRATNLQALQAVTRNGAMALGIDSRIGTLEIGKIADVIALRGNPLDDISNLANVASVMKSGHLIDERILAFAGQHYPGL